MPVRLKFPQRRQVRKAAAPAALAVTDTDARPSYLPSTNLLTAPAPARVLLAGPDTAVLAAAVTAIADDAGSINRDDRHGPRTVDAVVLGRGLPLPRRRALETEADEAGIPVVSLSKRPIVHVTEVNPSGWRRDTDPAIGVLMAQPDRTRAWGAVERAARRFGRERLVLLLADPWTFIDGRGLEVRRLPVGPRRQQVLHDLRGVADLPGLHDSAPARAEWLVELAARGIPVLATDLDELSGRIHEPLEHAMATIQLDDFDDAERRERVSIRLRRAALRHHGAPAVWRELAQRAGLPPPTAPSVSVLLASNRPNRLPEAVDRISRQNHERVEIVVAAHTDALPARWEENLRRRARCQLQLLRIDPSRPLGQVLQAASEVSSGDLIAKMDDDDLYDVGHLEDLIDALSYSGATIVGKGAEYVYLQPIDTTIRRFPNGAETSNRNLAGGALMMAREDLRRVGGWQSAPRAVDQRLLDDIERAGGSIHRTHGHGFVLQRFERGHTWEVPIDYFLRQAVEQWPGLALQAAGIR